MAREGRDEARRWLWSHSTRDRQRACGHTVVGQTVALTRVDGVARWGNLETCGSVWSCPVCSAKILAKRADDLVHALDAWHREGGKVAMVTLTMRHRRADSLTDCWDALGDAWAAASGRSRGVRTAKEAAGVVGWARRVEVTWGARHGWHVHVHALMFLDQAGDADQLAAAMYRAWELRLRKVGLTPMQDHGGLDVRVLALAEARAEIGAYVAKGVYTNAEQLRRAALELAAGGKVGRGENVTPWGLLDWARSGDRQAAALWAEWEAASTGRRAITWSRGLRTRLDLDVDVELDDHELAEDDDVVLHELVAVWSREDWPAIREAPLPHRRQLLEVAATEDLDEARYLIEVFTRAFGLPRARFPD